MLHPPSEPLGYEKRQKVFYIKIFPSSFFIFHALHPFIHLHFHSEICFEGGVVSENFSYYKSFNLMKFHKFLDIKSL